MLACGVWCDSHGSASHRLGSRAPLFFYCISVPEFRRCVQSATSGTHCQVCKLPGDLRDGIFFPGKVEDARYGIQGQCVASDLARNPELGQDQQSLHVRPVKPSSVTHKLVSQPLRQLVSLEVAAFHRLLSHEAGSKFLRGVTQVWSCPSSGLRAKSCSEETPSLASRTRRPS